MVCFLQAKFRMIAIKNIGPLLIVATIMLWSPYGAFAQELHSQSSKAIKLYQSARSMYEARMWIQAKKRYLEALEQDPKFPEAHIALANLLDKLRESPDDLQEIQRHRLAYLAALPQGPEASQAALRVGLYRIAKGEYPEADSMSKFLDSTTRQSPEGAYLLRTNDFVKAQKDVKKINALPLSPNVNALAHQYNPVIGGDNKTLYFIGLKSLSSQSNEDIYVSRADARGNWSRATLVPGRVNTKDGSEGCLTLSADGKTMVFAACDRRDSKGSCDLFISHLVGGAWTEPQNLEDVNSRSWDSQPSLSSDGRELYFVSKRPGGIGGSDIYVSQKTGPMRWSPPENLGPHINTIEDEIFPFVHASNQVLYFGSRGHAGYGGTDIFYCLRKGEGWSSPENVGGELNTYKSEAGFSIAPDGKIGYFFETSLKGNYQRIMGFDIPDNWKVKPSTFSLRIKVTDALSGVPLTASYQLSKLKNDSLSFSGVTEGYNGEGLLTINPGQNYGLFVGSDGYLPYSKTFLSTSALSETTLEIKLKPFKKGSRETLNNIFFEFNSAELTNESTTELKGLVQLLRQNPTLQIVIEGHTDEIGSTPSNQLLSEKRAKSVVNYLVKKGIAPNRLNAIGKGKSEPVIATGQAEQVNRRIEFVIR
jgi:OmpA-OmpF porin, OOP family